MTDATAVGAVDVGTEAGREADPPTRPRWERDWVTTVVILAAAVSLAPLVVAGVRGLATPWTPVSDRAIEALRMHDVGTRYTPLLGPYSRLGWRHPVRSCSGSAPRSSMIAQGADPTDVIELRALQTRIPYDVWLVPATEK